MVNLIVLNYEITCKIDILRVSLVFHVTDATTYSGFVCE
jgi:hypothetical protein